MKYNTHIYIYIYINIYIYIYITYIYIYIYVYTLYIWLVFQPCWKSNKTCPRFIHNRIHCVGDPSRLALKATFFRRLSAQASVVAVFFFRFPKRLRNHCSAVPWLIQECRQFSKVDSKGKTLLTGSTELKPDSKTCIQISTQACRLEGPMMSAPRLWTQVYQRLSRLLHIFLALT